MSLRVEGRILLILGSCLVRLGCLRAEDITTVDGTTFKHAEVIQFEADQMVIRHDGGTNRISWKELEPGSQRRYQTEAQKQKETEIQKLKQDLARAEAEAARLDQNEGPPRLKSSTPTGPSGPPARLVTREEPAKPAAELPPLQPGETVDVAGLVQQFKNDPSGTELRYRKKIVRVQGVIERFEPRMFLRKYEVLLASPDRFVRVIAVFDYPDDFKTVYTRQRGQTLVGKPAENKEVTLMQSGQTLLFQGRCKHARDAEIVFTGCSIIP